MQTFTLYIPQLGSSVCTFDFDNSLFSPSEIVLSLCNPKLDDSELLTTREYKKAISTNHYVKAGEGGLILILT